MGDRHRRSSRRFHEETGLGGHHDDVERGHRSLRRDPEHHLVHNVDRSYSRGRQHDDRHSHRGHYTDDGHEPLGDSELRRRQNRDHYGATPSRRSRHERDEVHEVRSESPLPPNPAPMDFPRDRSPGQNGHHGFEDHHRAYGAGYHGDGSRHREEAGHKHRVRTMEDVGHGSHLNIIAAEELPHGSRSRYNKSPRLSTFVSGRIAGKNANNKRKIQPEKKGGGIDGWSED